MCPGRMWWLQRLLLIMLSTCSRVVWQQDSDGDFTIEDFRNTLWQAYDNNVSFNGNFYALMGDLCPESVFCPSNVTTGLNEINGVAAGLHHDSKAREIIRNNAHKLTGCCLPCSCEKDCVERRNCCPSANQHWDIDVYDDDTHAERPKIQECVLASIKSYRTQTPAAITQGTFDKAYYMVTACFSTNFSDDIAEKCTNPDVMHFDETTPVYSHTHGKIYKNKFCAECNDAIDVVSWSPHVIFYRPMHILNLPSTQLDMYVIGATSNGKAFDLVYLPPDEMLLRSEQFSCDAHIEIATHEQACDESSTETIFASTDQVLFFQRACARQAHAYKIGKGFFNNVFCFFCESALPKTKLTCNASSKVILDKTFNALLNVDITDVRRQTNTIKESMCACTEYFDNRKNECRQLYCPPGWGHVTCGCRDFLTSITGMSARLYLEFYPEHHSDVFMERFGGSVSENDANKLSSIIKNRLRARWNNTEIKGLLLYRDNATSDMPYPRFYTVYLLTLKGEKDNRVRIRDIFETFDRGITVQVLNTPIAVRIGQIREITKGNGHLEMLFNSPIDRPDDATPTRITAIQHTAHDRLELGEVVSKLAYCERVQLDADEIDLLKNNSSMLGFAESRVGYIFNENDGSICVDEFERSAYFSQSNTPRLSDTVAALTWTVVLSTNFLI